MPISTANLDSGGDDPRAARTQILEAIQFINALGGSAAAGTVAVDGSAAYSANTIGYALNSMSWHNSVLRFIPASEWAAIKNFTSSFDATAAFNSLSGVVGALIPAGRYLVSGVYKNYRTSTFISAHNFNHAAGGEALVSITTGTANAAFGPGACNAVSSGYENTGIGFQALVRCNTGAGNTALGKDALAFVQGGSVNTGIGWRAGLAITSGNDNSAIGGSALLSCTTGIQNTALGCYSLSSLVNYNNSSAVGYFADVTGSNQVQLGNSVTTVYAYGAIQNRSDIRDKADVRDITIGLDFINALRPVDFRWDYREDYKETEKDGSKKRVRYHHGLIAQEVKATIDALGIDFGGYQDHSVLGGQDVKSLGYEELMAPMIKAIQQLTARVRELEERL